VRHVRLTVRSAAAACAVAAITLAGQAAAGAATASPNVAARPDGGPGHWSQVTGTTSDIADVGLVRGADGVLHVLWENGTISGHESIMDTPIAPNGTVGHAVTILGGLDAASFPDATATSNGLAVFWVGTKGHISGIYEATRPARGGHWSLGPVIPETLLPGSVSVGTASDGRPWVSFTDSFSMTLLHLGHPIDQVPTACCYYFTGLATDGVTGTSYVAYMSLVNKKMGIWVQRLSQAGITGAASRLPGSETGGNVQPLDQRVGITGRGHGRAGVYVSYDVGYAPARALDVYRLGASKPVTLATFSIFGEQLQGSTLTAGPDGRLWDAWIDGAGSTPQLFVRASSLNAATWGKAVHVPLPSGTQFVWQVYASAQAGRIDLVVLLTRNGHIADYATQSLLPPPPKK